MKCRAIVALEIAGPVYRSADDLSRLIADVLADIELDYHAPDIGAVMIEAVEVQSVAVSS